MAVAPSLMYIDMIKAFRSDCEMLIDKFKKKSNNDLKTFMLLWKSLNFQFIYDKKYSKSATEHDFKNDTLQIAKLIMLHDHFTGGMFLLYGLYCLQDYPVATIRLELDEFSHITEILRLRKEECRKKNYQLAWIFSTLLKEEAFNFVVFSREYDIEGQRWADMIYRNQYEFSDDDNLKIVTPKEWFHNFSKDNLPKEVRDLDSDYLVMKNRIKEELPFLSLSMDMVEEDISTTLLKALTQADSMAEPRAADDSIGARRRSLKNRKMRVKYKYQLDDTDEETLPNTISTSVKRKRGCPKGERMLFFNKIINDPDPDSSSDTGDSLEMENTPLKTKPGLPNILC